MNPTNEHRHKRLGPEDYEHIQESLDSLDWNITEEQAENVLREFGTSGKEIANQFIDRLLRERQEAIDALSSRDAEVKQVLEGLSKVLTFEHGPSQRCWCSAWVHTPACRAARDLYSRLQVAELQKREGRNTPEE